MPETPDKEPKPAAFYDEVYRASEVYNGPPAKAPWFLVWWWVVKRLSHTEPVIDLGCGTGQLAELLAGEGWPPHRYVGLDFSEVAIAHARERLPGYRFFCGGLGQTQAMCEKLPGGTAVLCEVLEHIAGDRRVLLDLPAGTRVLATLPMHDSEGHVRHFTSFAEVCRRYEPQLELQFVERVGRHICIDGRRRQRRAR